MALHTRNAREAIKLVGIQLGGIVTLDATTSGQGGGWRHRHHTIRILYHPAYADKSEAVKIMFLRCVLF